LGLKEKEGKHVRFVTGGRPPAIRDQRARGQKKATGAGRKKKESDVPWLKPFVKGRI